MKKALVIFSGGQDSTTCLFWAKNRFEVQAITFDYNQNHSIEIEQSKKICSENNIRQTVVDVSFLSQLVESALTSRGDVNKLNEKELPSSFVPNRNQLFITLAHAFAQKIKAEVLILGVCETDYSGYPDCRRDFIDLVEKTSNSGSKSEINIITPLMYLNKAETFKLAETEKCLEIVLNDSHTCYNGDRVHFHEWGFGCDNCPACELRKKGFEKFKLNY